MFEFFGRAVPFAWHLAVGVSFRAISLREKLTTNGELSSLFAGEMYTPWRTHFGAPPNARCQRLHEARAFQTGLCPVPRLCLCYAAAACFR